jgi:arylsulfatase A-like enzyme
LLPPRRAARPRRLPCAALACLLLVGCGRHDALPEQAAPPSVLIIGIDTMRGDHLHAAGNDSILTPHLDALARDGVLFTDANATAPWTLPSFASVFTGLLPRDHGAVGGERAWLAAEHTTMAEAFAAAGYATGGLAAVDWLTRACNMDQGFQPMSGLQPPPGLDRAGTETWLAGAWCARPRPTPFFLFLHYFDVHTPYTPPPPFDRMYYRGDPFADGEPVLDLLRSPRNRAPNSESGMYDFLTDVTDLEFPARQYAAGVSYADDHVGQVVAELKSQGLYDDLLIIVLSDHGEHLGEHDIWFTHLLPYQETLHVPLIVKLPRGRHAGAVVDEPVSLLDVLPTVLAEAGLEPARDLPGRDLRPLMAGRHDGRSLLAAEQGSDPESCSRSLREGRWKLLRFRTGSVERDELYDLETDPGETRDVAADHPDQLTLLRKALRALGPADEIVAGEHTDGIRPLDEATKRRLRSLGY